MGHGTFANAFWEKDDPVKDCVNLFYVILGETFQVSPIYLFRLTERKALFKMCIF